MDGWCFSCLSSSSSSCLYQREWEVPNCAYSVGMLDNVCLIESRSLLGATQIIRSAPLRIRETWPNHTQNNAKSNVQASCRRSCAQMAGSVEGWHVFLLAGAPNFNLRDASAKSVACVGTCFSPQARQISMYYLS